VDKLGGKNIPIAQMVSFANAKRFAVDDSFKGIPSTRFRPHMIIAAREGKWK
jgi:hypothetical protein